MSVRISLTAQEEQTFAVFLAVAKSLNATVRAAGGWVRDKVLGLSSNDIDIALDTIDGETFAKAAREYALSTGNVSVSRIGEIKANPDKSKHLQTATFVMNGLSIDANNLRSESYTEHSRIPVTKFGSPKEDAERRDFTINSLFYNLNSGDIEDQTGKGLDDLTKSILRTPLPAATTFSDDPLRIVRAVRFASRFQLNIDPEISSALNDFEICKSLTVKKINGVTVSKVSGERIGAELNKMLSLRDGALTALEIFHSTKVGEAILKSVVEYADFSIPSFIKNISPKSPKSKKACYINHFASLDEQQHRLLSLCLFAAPIRNFTIPDGKKITNAGCALYRDILKLSKNDAETVGFLLESTKMWKFLSFNRNKMEIGRILRRAKNDWKVLSCLTETIENMEISPFDNWLENESSLINCWEWKAPFDGIELQKKFHAVVGPQISRLIDLQLDLMYENVSTKDIEEHLINEIQKSFVM